MKFFQLILLFVAVSLVVTQGAGGGGNSTIKALIDRVRRTKGGKAAESVHRFKTRQVEQTQPVQHVTGAMTKTDHEEKGKEQGEKKTS